MTLEYSGMTYEQASREIERLLQKALKNGQRFAIIEKLYELRGIALREREGRIRRSTLEHVDLLRGRRCST